eukprot:469784-Pelagomonas_calceolata.AAC.1
MGFCWKWPPRPPAQAPTLKLGGSSLQANAKAARKGKPAAQKNPVGCPPGDSSAAAALASNTQ